MAISTPYPYTLLNGTTADATQVMTNFNQIQNDVNANAANNGANNNITSLTGLTTPLTPGSGGTIVYNSSTTTNVANAYTVATTVPSNWNNNQGQGLVWVPNATNTAGTATLTVNGKTTKNIKKLNLAGTVVDVAAGDIVANVQAFVLYDGTQFIITDPMTGVPTNATLKNDGSGNLTTSLFTESTIASAATTDLGTMSSNIGSITGTTGITAFGSSANTANPLYFLRFTGILTLTNNGTSLILPGGQNITTAAGDTAVALYLGSGNWKVLHYTSVAPGVTAGTYTNSTVTVNARGVVTSAASGATATLGTPQNTTSGTEIDFTGIPSTAKIVFVTFTGVSTSGTSAPLVQLGSASGGYETTGYLGSSGISIASSVGSVLATTGIEINLSGGLAAAALMNGSIMLVNLTGNIWTVQGVVGLSNTASVSYVGYSKSLSSTLDRLRLTTANGTDTFDAGQMNIAWI